MLFWIVVLLVALWMTWQVYQKWMNRKIGTYRLISGENFFYLEGDVPAEHWVRLAAHVVGARLFYFRGTQTFDTMVEAAYRALEEPTIEILNASLSNGAQEQGVLTYRGVGLKGFIGSPGITDDRPTRYRREIEGVIRWVFENENTVEEARTILPQIIRQEDDKRLVDFGRVNNRIRRHFS